VGGGRACTRMGFDANGRARAPRRSHQQGLVHVRLRALLPLPLLELLVLVVQQAAERGGRVESALLGLGGGGGHRRWRPGRAGGGGRGWARSANGALPLLGLCYFEIAGGPGVAGAPQGGKRQRCHLFGGFRGAPPSPPAGSTLLKKLQKTHQSRARAETALRGRRCTTPGAVRREQGGGAGGGQRHPGASNAHTEDAPRPRLGGGGGVLSPGKGLHRAEDAFRCFDAYMLRGNGSQKWARDRTALRDGRGLGRPGGGGRRPPAAAHELAQCGGPLPRNLLVCARPFAPLGPGRLGSVFALPRAAEAAHLAGALAQATRMRWCVSWTAGLSARCAVPEANPTCAPVEGEGSEPLRAPGSFDRCSGLMRAHHPAPAARRIWQQGSGAPHAPMHGGVAGRAGAAAASVNAPHVNACARRRPRRCALAGPQRWLRYPRRVAGRGGGGSPAPLCAHDAKLLAAC
jgi:hypothetical protein